MEFELITRESERDPYWVHCTSMNFLQPQGVNTFWLSGKPYYRTSDLNMLNRIVPREASSAWVDSENCAYSFLVGHGWSKI